MRAELSWWYHIAQASCTQLERFQSQEEMSKDRKGTECHETRTMQRVCMQMFTYCASYRSRIRLLLKVPPDLHGDILQNWAAGVAMLYVYTRSWCKCTH